MHLFRAPSRHATRDIPALRGGAQAWGAIATGALAMGALALGAVAIGRLAVGRARIRRLEIDDLVVHRLRVLDGRPQPVQGREEDVRERADAGAAGMPPAV
jgi:hypothetical protein